LLLAPNLSQENINPEHRVDENVDGARLGTPFRTGDNKIKNENEKGECKLAPCGAAQKIFAEVHPDWRVAS